MKRCCVFLTIALVLLLSTSLVFAQGKSITIAVQSHSSLDALAKFFDEFTAQTGIKVIMDQSPQDQLSQKILLDLSVGTGAYDVIGIHEIWLGSYVDAGWLHPLDDYIAAAQAADPEGFDYDDFVSTEAFNYKGVQYGLPLYNEAHLLFYNTEIFEEAGLTRPPETWSELEEWARIIQEKTGKAGIAMRGISDNRAIIYTWNIFAYSNGWPGWFDEDLNPLFDRPEAIEAAEFYCHLLNTYGPKGVASYNWPEVQTLMQQGLVGMIIDASNFGARLENPETSTITGKVGYAMVPNSDKTGLARPGVLSYGLYIPASSKNPDEAWEFIKWALSKEMQLKTALVGSREDVTRASVILQPEYMEKYNVSNYLEAKADAFAVGMKHYPLIVPFEQVAAEVSVTLNRILTGGDAETLMKRLNQRIDQIMRENGF
ncbi:MAG: ABC transporter substrate-binding protein [Limnochordia bacterium]|jgi:multiple sugar transport system substrate-binding protein